MRDIIEFVARIDDQALETAALLLVGLAALLFAPDMTRWQAELMGGSDDTKRALVVLARVIGAVFVVMGLGRLLG